jgi:hypothetical protein
MSQELALEKRNDPNPYKEEDHNSKIQNDIIMKVTAYYVRKRR